MASLHHNIDNDPQFRAALNEKAQKFLEDNGDTNIRLGKVTFEREESSERAMVYWVQFETDAGSGIIDITHYHNDTFHVSEP